MNNDIYIILINFKLQKKLQHIILRYRTLDG